MNISAETFDAAIKSLTAQARTPQKDDHRRFPRARFSGGVTIIPCSRSSDRKPVTVSVRDVSPRGIGILHQQPMSAGEQFILYLPAAQGQAKAIRCTVSRWQPMDEGVFAISAVFDQELSPAMAPGAAGSLHGLTADEKQIVRELEQRLDQVNR